MSKPINEFRWNQETKTWEFFESAWGGWCTLRVSPSDSSRPMTLTEGVSYLLLSGRDDVVAEMIRGRAVSA